MPEKLRKHFIPKKYVLPLLLPVQIALLQIISLFPEAVERYYSNGIYPVISAISRTVSGLIPFSAGDVIYGIAIGLLLRWIWNRRRGFWRNWKENFLQLAGFVSVFYFLFNFLWALNYYRVRLPEKLGISTEYSDEQLLNFTRRAITKTNEIHLQITRDADAKVVVPYTHEQVFEKNLLGYQAVARQYPFFRYSHPSVKKSIISIPLSYMGFAGYLNPFTNEAQVNYLLPMYTFPTVSCHEMAHQIGYASESEANFVGYLASVNNPDKFIQYSGYVTALRYCLGNWEARDEAIARELLADVNPGILKNFGESEDFWDSYESFIETGFHIFYHNFLKINQQEEGLDSYSRFVDLLVNYYGNRKL